MNKVNEKEYGEMWGLSGFEDVLAYTRFIKPVEYFIFSKNNLSKEMEKLAMQRLY